MTVRQQVRLRDEAGRQIPPGWHGHSINHGGNKESHRIAHAWNRRAGGAIVAAMLFESMLAIGAVLLMGSGGMKLFDRAPTRGALSASGLPSSEPVVLVLAATEIAIGSSVITIDHPAAALALATIYLGFAGFVAYALRRRLPIQSCGCFGKSDTPPSLAHLVVNLTLAASGVVVATSDSVAARLGTGSAWSVAGLLGMAAIGAYVTYLLLAEFPATMSAVRGSP